MKIAPHLVIAIISILALLICYRLPKSPKNGRPDNSSGSVEQRHGVGNQKSEEPKIQNATEKDLLKEAEHFLDSLNPQEQREQQKPYFSKFLFPGEDSRSSAKPLAIKPNQNNNIDDRILQYIYYQELKAWANAAKNRPKRYALPEQYKLAIDEINGAAAAVLHAIDQERPLNAKVSSYQPIAYEQFYRLLGEVCEPGAPQMPELVEHLTDVVNNWSTTGTNQTRFDGSIACSALFSVLHTLNGPNAESVTPHRSNLINLLQQMHTKVRSTFFKDPSAITPEKSSIGYTDAMQRRVNLRPALLLYNSATITLATEKIQSGAAIDRDLITSVTNALGSCSKTLGRITQRDLEGKSQIEAISTNLKGAGAYKGYELLYWIRGGFSALHAGAYFLKKLEQSTMQSSGNNQNITQVRTDLTAMVSDIKNLLNWAQENHTDFHPSPFYEPLFYLEIDIQLYALQILLSRKTQ